MQKRTNRASQLQRKIGLPVQGKVRWEINMARGLHELYPCN